MTDLDFDELDKAVSNLMGDTDTSKRAPGLDDPEEKVVDLSAAMPPSTPIAPLGDTISTTPSPSVAASVPAVAPITPLAVKRRGQFMDIMHPASPQPTSTVTRQSPTIQPIPSPSDSDEIISTDPVAYGRSVGDGTEVSPAEQESTGIVALAESAVREQEAPVVSDGGVIAVTEETPPQPISLHNQNSSLPREELRGVVSGDQISGEPLVSPFLPDTKVEKRPLGTPPVPFEQPIQPADAVATSTPDLSIDISETSVADVGLPVELNGDIVALESSNVVNGDISTTASEASVAGEAVADAEQHEPSLPPVPSGAITQQYAEQPSTGDQTSGVIFDTATYHKSIDTPTKKKHSFVTWLLWVLVLISLGAAAGAGYFFWSVQ